MMFHRDLRAMLDQMVKYKIFLGDLARGNLYPFYLNRTLALKETTNNTKQP
jgi:hypothetical protein